MHAYIRFIHTSIHTSMHTYMHTCIYAYIHTHRQTGWQAGCRQAHQTSLCMCVYILCRCLCMPLCTAVQTNSMYVCMHASMDVCLFVSVYVRMHSCAHTHHGIQRLNSPQTLPSWFRLELWQVTRPTQAHGHPAARCRASRASKGDKTDAILWRVPDPSYVGFCLLAVTSQQG